MVIDKKDNLDNRELTIGTGYKSMCTQIHMFIKERIIIKELTNVNGKQKATTECYIRRLGDWALNNLNDLGAI